MSELVYAVCAWILFPINVYVVNYNVYINGELSHTQQEDTFNVCSPVGNPYGSTDYSYSVDYWPPGWAAPYVSEVSPALHLQWVWDADFDENRVVGWSDFGLFSRNWQSSEPRYDYDKDGVVGWADYGAFTDRWGDCLSTNRVKVVPCTPEVRQ